MGDCADELTVVDIDQSTSLQGRVSAGSAETSILYSSIDKDNVFGLNLTVPEHAQEIIKPWDQRESTAHWGDSSVDDQMIIHIPFTQNVRIKSIIVKLGRGELCPNRLRIYANAPNGIDFNEESKPSQDISLYSNEPATEYPLRVTAFADVNTVTLLFSDSPSMDSSRVYFIGFKGETKRPLKEPGSKLEIQAANATDAPVDRLAERAAGRQNTIR